MMEDWLIRKLSRFLYHGDKELPSMNTVIKSDLDFRIRT